MRRAFPCILLFITPICAAAQGAGLPHPGANKAFERHVADVESRLAQEHASKENPIPVKQSDWSKLGHGGVLLEAVAAGKKVPGGMLHDWQGTMFLPGATAPEFLKVVLDPDHFSSYYAPQVERSRLVQDRGPDQIVALRLRYQKILTVILDSEYAVHSGSLGSGRGYSFSRSTRISEIADAGSSHEHPVADGSDHGFLWRLNTYWSYEEVNGGLLLRCEAISLTRDTPFGTEWVIGPLVWSVPRESLEFTLEATRKAMALRRSDGN